MRPPTEPVPNRFRFLLAAAGGGVLVLAFPPVGFWPAAPVAACVLSLVVHGRSVRAGLWLGLVFGLAFMLPLLHWSATYVGAVPWLILGVFQAIYLGLLGGALTWVQRLRFWPLWAAATWVAEEALRDRFPFGGFPWGRLAFSQPQGTFLPYAAFGGAPLVTFAVALTGCLAARAVMAALAHGSRRAVVLAAAGIVLVPLVGTAMGLAVHSGKGSRQVTVATVQGNVPRLGLDFDAQREAVLRNHYTSTMALARRVEAGTAPQPKIVLWPENSSDIDPLRNPDAAALITSAARAVGAPILVGAILDGPGNHIRNAGIVWDPTSGPGAMYVKRHPVPFGEYIPLRSLARRVTTEVDLVPRDMLPGHTVGSLHIGGLTVGDVICFEVAYDGLVRSDVSHGAQLIVTQTNNATFGRSGESPQQVAMARLRAVEHDRANLVVSTSGISAVIGPDGRVRHSSAVFTASVFDGAVPVQHGTTVATRLGALPEWVLTAIALGALVAPGALRLYERTVRRGRIEHSPDRVKEPV